MSDRPLLMIPGPIELAPRVREVLAEPPPSHLAPGFVEAFGATLQRLRDVWLAAPDAQPYVIAGSGTIAMEMAVWNLVEPGDRAVVVNSGYFSDRIAQMLRTAGAEVVEVESEPGAAPEPERVEQVVHEAARQGRPFRLLYATHVDTSTGVRVDARALARVARDHDLLSIFDGVCSVAGERFAMADWDADVLLTASQKALGAPPGLALLLTSRRAEAARAELRRSPPLALDWEAWRPIMRAYEERRNAYFSTPATGLVLALHAAVSDLLDSDGLPRDAMERRFQQHDRAACAMRAAWDAMGLELLPRPEFAANTLSAIRYPKGVDASLVAAIGRQGVIVAGGLYPSLRNTYFRVGHMGHVVTQPDDLARTVRAVAEGLTEIGRQTSAKDAERALRDML